MLSVCMIVLDEEECISRSLTSIHPYIDEIVIVDGGSKDKTREIATTFNKVILLENSWPEDYSIQRNIAIDHSKGDWIFSLDADEYLMEYVGQNLKRLTEFSEYDAYRFMYKHFFDNNFDNIFSTDYHIKMFKRHCRFVGKYHEAPEGYKTVIDTNMEIWHYKKAEWQQKDNEHYWDLGQKPSPGWIKTAGKWVNTGG